MYTTTESYPVYKSWPVCKNKNKRLAYSLASSWQDLNKAKGNLCTWCHFAKCDSWCQIDAEYLREFLSQLNNKVMGYAES